jgi:hypothetical protein
MSNLTRYDLGGYDCGQTCTACGMEVSADGEYVKFDDIKELLNSSHNTARNEIAVDLLRSIMARTLFSAESQSIIVSEFQRQLSSVA